MSLLTARRILETGTRKNDPTWSLETSRELVRSHDNTLAYRGQQKRRSEHLEWQELSGTVLRPQGGEAANSNHKLVGGAEPPPHNGRRSRAVVEHQPVSDPLEPKDVTQPDIRLASGVIGGGVRERLNRSYR